MAHRRERIREVRELCRDIVGPFDAWPRELSDCFFRLINGQHISNQNRFKLSSFLLVNGLNPEFLPDIFNLTYANDNTVKSQLAFVVRQFEAGNRSYFAYNISEGARMNFAMEVVHKDGYENKSRRIWNEVMRKY
jgi:hypothetical protein